MPAPNPKEIHARNPETESPPVHIFEDSGEAYDSANMGCTWDEEGEEVPVNTGDVLVIPSEKVVALSWAWPVAVTKNPGNLHTLGNGLQSLYNLQEPRKPGGEGGAGFTDLQVACALCEAARRGWPLAEGLEDWTASYARTEEDKNHG